MIVAEASDDDIRHICRHLRAHDRIEQFCTRFDDDPERLAADLIRARAAAIQQLALFTDDGEPAVLVGAYLRSPSVATIHMCGTERLPEVARAGHRWWRRRFIPCALVPNVRRAETRILAADALIRRWVATCGFVEEGPARACGRNGEDFVHVAWINPDPPKEGVPYVWG